MEASINVEGEMKNFLLTEPKDGSLLYVPGQLYMLCIMLMFNLSFQSMDVLTFAAVLDPADHLDWHSSSPTSLTQDKSSSQTCYLSPIQLLSVQWRALWH